MSRIAFKFCAVLTSTAVALSLALPAASAAKPQIGDTRVERAPVGKKGGLMNPVAYCSGSKEPKVRTVVEGLANDFHEVWEYRGALPGLFFPRVEVGQYQLTTRARCGGKRAKRVEVVTVRQKTAKTTVSRAEFRRVKPGMTRTKVRRIIGYDGRGSRHGNRMFRTYDMMPFWAYAGVEFRNGRVVAKHWKLDHD